MKSGKVACTKKVANCINCMVVKYLEMITIFDNLLHHLLLPFPPEILLYAGPHAGHEVVEVHHDVDPHVEEATEGGVTSSDKLGVEYPINTNLTELYLMETFVKCLFK